MFFFSNNFSDYNPKQDEQAIGRAHRIGQKNEVLTIRLVAIHDSEDRVQFLAKKKSDFAKEILSKTDSELNIPGDFIKFDSSNTNYVCKNIFYAKMKNVNTYIY